MNNNPPNPTPSVTEELKPCPFCRSRLQEDGNCWHHEMADCPLSDSVFDEDQIAEWNTRTDQPPPNTGLTDVERVARALYLAENPNSTVPYETYAAAYGPDNPCSYIPMARAAIAAMQPTGQVTDDVERVGPTGLYGAVGVAMFKADLGDLPIDQKINFVGNAAYLAMQQHVHADEVERVAETLANQVAMRKGCPPIKNCLALMPPELAENFREDARAALLVSNRSGVGRLREALEKCRDKFLEYELSHKREAENQARNGWLDAEKARLEKAQRNREMADLCSTALDTTAVVEGRNGD